MGIRIDQIHPEVFSKISADLSSQNQTIIDYLNNKISEIDVAFGLPETSVIEKVAEISKRNLEKSGFIDLNRDFVQNGTKTQADTGVWITNLKTNESPFEPRTIDGQTRGISIAGTTLNYTLGDIGQNVKKMLSLPIAQNLPIFYPSDSDMVYEFKPVKSVSKHINVTDNSISLNFIKDLTQDYSVKILRADTGSGIETFYLDINSDKYIISSDESSYLSTDISKAPIYAKYITYNNYFGTDIPHFVKIIDSDAITKYVDANNRLFDIVTDNTQISALNAQYLKTNSGSQVYFSYVDDYDIDGNKIVRPSFVSSSLISRTLSDGVNYNEYSDLFLYATTNDMIDETGIKSVNSNDIKFYLEEENRYFYFPKSSDSIHKKYFTPIVSGIGDLQIIKDGTGTDTVFVQMTVEKTQEEQARDDEGNLLFNEDGTPVMTQTTFTVDEEVQVPVFTETAMKVKYFMNPIYVGGNTDRPVILKVDGTLVYFAGGTETSFSKGRELFVNLSTGTKYFKSTAGKKFFVDVSGTAYFVDNDVTSVAKYAYINSDTQTSYEILVYTSKVSNRFYLENSIRKYLDDVTFSDSVLIQATDMDSNLIFVNAAKEQIHFDTVNRVYFKVVSSTDSDGIVTNTQTNVVTTIDQLTPIFETREMFVDELNSDVIIPFNIVQGDIELLRDDYSMKMYDDYEVTASLRLLKDLEYNELTRVGDTLYIKRIGKKDLILRLEKDLGKELDNSGKINLIERVSGNDFKWTQGQLLNVGQQLDYNDIVKKDKRYFQYKGSAVKYKADDDINNKINVIEGGLFWEDVTVQICEWERKGNQFNFFNVDKGEVIRFIATRTVWTTNVKTGEKVETTLAPYIVTRTALDQGENVITINDANFVLDADVDPTLISYKLVVEYVRPYSTFTNNRANNFKLTLTGLQSVAKNEDAAMIYSDDYFLSENHLIMNNIAVNNFMRLTRYNAPQNELQIDFIAPSDYPKVSVPFEIALKNKFDVIKPQVLNGNKYNWMANDHMPTGKILAKNDIVFDKTNMKFYQYLGNTLSAKENISQLSTDIKKEIVRHMMSLEIGVEPYSRFYNVDKYIAVEAAKLSSVASLNLTYLDANGLLITNNADVNKYFALALANLITTLEHNLNDSVVDAMPLSDTVTSETKVEIKRILATYFPQTVLKKVKLNSEGKPDLDRDGNNQYYFEYSRFVRAEKNDQGQFIDRTITGVESVNKTLWKDVTVSNLAYYRNGKTFTIINMKPTDYVTVTLDSSGSAVFTSSTAIANINGSLTFAVDFNIETPDTGDIIPHTVTYYEKAFTEGVEYTRENQNLTLKMLKKGDRCIVKRNDIFNVDDIVLLERRDLVFVESWHEAVSETGYIFPFGNVQYLGDIVNGVQTKLFDGNQAYCQHYDIGSIVYNYYNDVRFESLSDDEKTFLNKTFVSDTTIGKGWKLDSLTPEQKKAIFNDSRHNLYFDGNVLVQIRFRTRVAALNLFENFFKGTSEYMSKGLRYQGKSQFTENMISKVVGTTDKGSDIIETVTELIGADFIVSTDHKSVLYKDGKIFDSALFTVQEKTDLSYNGVINAIPVSIVKRRNQGVYHSLYNPNGTAFFINGITVAEDKQDFSDDITGFTLRDEKGSTLETASIGRDRKEKFKVMLTWLFSGNYKAGGNITSKTTYRPDGLLYDEVNKSDIYDLRVDANDQRRRIEELEIGLTKEIKNRSDLENTTTLKFDQQKQYIDTTSNLIYSQIAKTETGIRTDMLIKENAVTTRLDTISTSLADLSANVFTKSLMTDILIDCLSGTFDYYDLTAFVANKKPTRDGDIAPLVKSLVENTEGSYTRTEFMKFFTIALKLLASNTLLTADDIEKYIKRLSVKDLVNTSEDAIYSRGELLEIISEGLTLISNARVIPPKDSDIQAKWSWNATQYTGFLGNKVIDLKKDFLDRTDIPLSSKTILNDILKDSYVDEDGKNWNLGYISGPTVWGNTHNYAAIYTTWIFVNEGFTIENMMLNGDDSHAIYINKELVAANKYCCKNTPYTYEFRNPGWYRIDLVYSEAAGGHYVQLGWNPKDYPSKIKYMTNQNMDAVIADASDRLDNWSEKIKSLMATIVGDNTGYFTKLETKLIVIEGINRIRNDMILKGATVTPSDIALFNKTLTDWLDNKTGTGLLTKLSPSYTVVQKDASGQPRSDMFRPTIDASGYYNASEVVEIIRKGLSLVNGIDAMNKLDLETWVARLDIKIPMTTSKYYTKAQINSIVTEGINKIAGMDASTTFDINSWLNSFIVKKGSVFVDIYGTDLRSNTATTSYTKVDFRAMILTKLTAIIGAQKSRKV